MFFEIVASNPEFLVIPLYSSNFTLVELKTILKLEK